MGKCFARPCHTAVVNFNNRPRIKPNTYVCLCTGCTPWAIVWVLRYVVTAHYLINLMDFSLFDVRATRPCMTSSVLEPAHWSPPPTSNDDYGLIALRPDIFSPNFLIMLCLLWFAIAANTSTINVEM